MNSGMLSQQMGGYGCDRVHADNAIDYLKQRQKTLCAKLIELRKWEEELRQIETALKALELHDGDR